MIFPAYLHANSVVFQNKGLLIIGQSGSGKSDLSLRLIDAGGVLVSDDYTNLNMVHDKDNIPLIYASCPHTIKGLLEVRGVGIIQTPFVESHKIDYILELSENYPRMPQITYSKEYSVSIRKFFLNPFELSVIHKIKIITELITGL